MSMKKLEEVMDIEQEQKNKVLVLKINGRLDAVSSPQAEKRIFDLISQGKLYLLLNFAEVTYLSSAGMRMLLSASKKLKALSGRLVICQVTTNVMDVLKMSGFEHVIEIVPTLQDGLKKFE